MSISDPSEDAAEPLLEQDAQQITCHGETAVLMISEAGLTYTPRAGVFRRVCCCIVPKQNRPLQVDAAHIVGAALVSPTSLKVWYVEPIKGSAANATAHAVRLVKTQPLTFPGGQEAAQTVERIRRAFCWWGRQQPPRVHAIVNPASGQGRALQLFQRQVLPMLEDAAGLTVTVDVTQGPGHATQLVRALDPAAADVLLCVGGDGTMFEVVQGLIDRPDWEAACRLRLAHCPGGGGNGVAHSCGLRNPATAAWAVVKGAASPLDAASAVLAPARRALWVLSLNYALLSNLDERSEPLRWLGDARFTVAALWEVLLANAYGMRMAWLPGSSAPAAGGGGAAPADAHQHQQQRLLASCADGASEAASAPPPARERRAPPDGGGGGGGGGAALDWSALPAGPPLPRLRALGQLPPSIPPSWSPPPGWQYLEAPVATWGAFNLPFLAEGMRFNPWGRLCAGELDVQWVRARGGMAQRRLGLQVLLKADEGGHVTMPEVEHTTAQALLVETLDPRSHLRVDGERLQAAQAVGVEVHAGLLTAIVHPECSAAAGAPAHAYGAGG